MRMTTRRLGLVLLAVLLFSSMTSTSYGAGPTFAANGRISGTDLLYENLGVNKNGIAVVNIYNPSKRSVSFNVTFSFLNAKGQLLESFTLTGYARSNSRVSYVEDGIDYAGLKSAKSVKVLGRSGQTLSN